jgi:hypothetical protein
MNHQFVCGGCNGRRVVRRHGEQEKEACGMCGGRGWIWTSIKMAMQVGLKLRRRA